MRTSLRMSTLVTVIALGLSMASQVAAAPVPAIPNTSAAAQDAIGTPFLPPDLPPSISEAGAEPLSVHDCDNVIPRTREDVSQVLAIAPSSADGKNVSDDDPRSRPAAPVVPIENVPADTMTQIEATLRTWQVCKALGLTYQEMALETDQFLREAIYPSIEIRTPLTEATINELLDRREEVDGYYFDRYSMPGVMANRSPLAIDLTGSASVSADVDYVILEAVVVYSNNGEQILNRVGFVSFRLVEGTWLVDRVSLTQY